MKKKLFASLAMLLLTAMLLPAVSVQAASNSLSGSSTSVLAGSKLTVTYYVDGTDVLGVQGVLNYDSSQLTLESKSKKIADTWDLQWNGNNFVASDRNQTAPINSKTAVFSATFKVNSNLAAGTSVTISVTGTKSSDSSYKSTKLGDASFTFKVAAPKSDNANLKSLVVSNASFSPAFSKGTTSYTSSVPFEVTSLKITAEPEDPDAKVTISNNKLAENATTSVKITVTAPAGNTKVYTIKVSRPKDPNYVPSSNANIGTIKVDGYVLSPKVDPNMTEYVVWVPTETTSVKVTAAPQDSLGSAKVSGGSDLEIGDNPVTIAVTAENGTTKEYTVVVKRAQDHDHDKDVPVTRKLSDDATIKDIEIAGGTVSPAFEPDRTEYEVSIPYEIPGFFANCTLADGATAAFKENPGELPVGETEVVLVVTAEDGETVKEYTFHVTREEEVIPDEPEDPTDPDCPGDTDGDGKCDCWTCRNLWWLLLAGGGAGAGTGSAITYSAQKNKKKEEKDESFK